MNDEDRGYIDALERLFATAKTIDPKYVIKASLTLAALGYCFEHADKTMTAALDAARADQSRVEASIRLLFGHAVNNHLKFKQ